MTAAVGAIQAPGNHMSTQHGAPRHSGLEDQSAAAAPTPPLAVVQGSWAAAWWQAPLRRSAVGVVDGRMRLARSLTLAIGDSLSLIIGALLLGRLGVAPHVDLSKWLVIAVMWLAGGTLLYLYRGGGELHLSSGLLDEVRTLLVWSSGVVVAGSLLGASMTRGGAAMLACVAFGLACAARSTVLLGWRRLTPPEPVLLVGGDRVRDRVGRMLELERSIKAELVAQIGGSDELVGFAPADLASAVRQAVELTRCQRVVVSGDDLDAAQLRAVADAARTADLKMSVLPTIGGAIGSRARLRHLAELPVLEYHCRPISRTAEIAKRSFDLVLGIAGLIVTAPVLIVIALTIHLDDRGPVFFCQLRGGRGGTPFRMLKFRTLHARADEELSALFAALPTGDPMYKISADDPHVTRIGRFLRRTSLDELPQLINVVRGDMSIVGPRPEDYRLVQRYDAEALSIRCGLRPGITGPMQVHGRGDLRFRERLDLEREYIENYSLVADVRILAQTVSVLMSKNGAY